MLCVLAVLLVLSVGKLQAQLPLLQDDKVSLGEELNYKVSFGFLTVGEAKISTNNDIANKRNRNCYHIDIEGKTLGAVAWFAKVNDRWGAYIDTSSLLPVYGYRNIRENSYKRDETTQFYQDKHQLRYQRHNFKNDKPDPPKYLEARKEVLDLISAYQYLRRLDYNRIGKSDTIKIYGFFEDEFYDFEVLYVGKERIKTELGKMTAYKLIPLMPDNKIFDGENAISIWISADENRIPLLIKANMFVGSGIVEIERASNLKHPY